MNATDNRIAFIVTEPDRRGLHVGVMGRSVGCQSDTLKRGSYERGGEE
jgi:hypothetical protein